MWNISVTARKDQLQDKLEQEINKYAAVDFYDGMLNTIWPFVEANIASYNDNQVITVKSNGGENITFDAPYTHMLSVIVGNG